MLTIGIEVVNHETYPPGKKYLTYNSTPCNNGTRSKPSFYLMLPSGMVTMARDIKLYFIWLKQLFDTFPKVLFWTGKPNPEIQGNR